VSYAYGCHVECARLELARTNSLGYEWAALMLAERYGQIDCGTAVLTAGAVKCRAEYDEQTPLIPS
jgi:hypothetical protein